MEIACPGAFDLLLRPPTLGANEGGYRVGWRKAIKRIPTSFREHHAQAFRRQRLKHHGRADLRHKRSSGLFRRLERDTLPTRHTLRGVARVTQMNVRITRDQRCHALHAKLSRLLYHEVKLLALQQRDAQIKLQL